MRDASTLGLRWLSALALILTCSVSQTPEEDASEQGAAPAAAREVMMFTIELSSRGRGYLRNTSETDQLVLHSSTIQPSEPILCDADGQPIAFFDTRALKKFDNTVWRSMFVTLEAGQRIELFGFEVSSSGTEVVWGPFRRRDLQPGRYRARIRWTSAINSYFDEESSEKRALPEVWLGTVESNEIELTIP